MGAKRLRQSKHAKEIRARCQQLQQYNNQLELERATFERQNQKYDSFFFDFSASVYFHCLDYPMKWMN